MAHSGGLSGSVLPARPRGPTSLSSAGLLYLVLKEGAQGTAKRLGVALKVVTELLAQHGLQLGGLLGAAIRQLLSTSPGRLLLALGASILCISWKLRRSGADLNISSSLSLLFGLIKVQGTMGVRLGPGGGSSDDEPRPAPTDELRINCPQDLKDSICRFLEAQAARDPSAMPTWQLSPQKAPPSTLTAATPTAPVASPLPTLTALSTAAATQGPRPPLSLPPGPGVGNGGAASAGWAPAPPAAAAAAALPPFSFAHLHPVPASAGVSSNSISSAIPIPMALAATSIAAAASAAPPASNAAAGPSSCSPLSEVDVLLPPPPLAPLATVREGPTSSLDEEEPGTPPTSKPAGTGLAAGIAAAAAAAATTTTSKAAAAASAGTVATASAASSMDGDGADAPRRADGSFAGTAVTAPLTTSSYTGSSAASTASSVAGRSVGDRDVAHGAHGAGSLEAALPGSASGPAQPHAHHTSYTSHVPPYHSNHHYVTATITNHGAGAFGGSGAGSPRSSFESSQHQHSMQPQTRGPTSHSYVKSGLLASLGPGADETPMDQSAYASLLQAAATYKPSVALESAAAAAAYAARAVGSLAAGVTGGGSSSSTGAAAGSTGGGAGKGKQAQPQSHPVEEGGSGGGGSSTGKAGGGGKGGKMGSSGVAAAFKGATTGGTGNSGTTTSSSSSKQGASASSSAVSAPRGAPGSAGFAPGAAGLKKSPESILGLRNIGIEGWQDRAGHWERLHTE